MLRNLHRWNTCSLPGKQRVVGLHTPILLRANVVRGKGLGNDEIIAALSKSLRTVARILDEACKQLFGEVRPPDLARSLSPVHVNYEY